MGRIYVVLTPEQLEFIKTEMASGRCETRSQALKTCLQHLKERDQQKKDGDSSASRIALGVAPPSSSSLKRT